MSELSPSNLCLLYYLDETGHEEFADPRYPIFGIAGCAVLAGTCFRLVDEPWREMKQEFFGSRDTPLHANRTLASATPEQRQAIEIFFRETLFSRFATIVRFDAPIPAAYPPYQIVAGTTLKRIEEIAMPYPLDSMALIFEESERGDKLVRQYFGSIRAENDAIKPLPVHRCFMSKAAGEPGLEIADFIANTAGRHVRHALRVGTHDPSSLFKAIFHCVPKPLVSYIEITAASKENSESGEGRMVEY